MKRFLLVIASILILLTASPITILAASPSRFFPTIHANAIPVFLKFQNETRVWFTPLLTTKHVSWLLEYKAGGVMQGASGSFSPVKVVEKRNIPLMTCSGNTCVNHAHITDMKLTVKFTYKDNSTQTKTYPVTTY